MSAPLRSMTGFARSRRPLGDGELVVSIKTVNHRGLDLHIQASPTIDPFEASIRALVKGLVIRGHVEVRVSLPRSSANGSILALNRDFLDQYLRTFREEAERYGLDSRPDLNTVLRLPGMLADGEESGIPEGTEAALRETLEEALHELNKFRSREGAEIADELRIHNAQITAAVQEMEQLREGTAEAFQKRLNERLQDLLSGAQIDPQRLAHEAAILADRSDIGEELARLRIHATQLAALIDCGGEAGKKLDFLLQEMNRETNTILSKTGGAGEAAIRISDLALAVKAAIEKMREQSLNLE